MSVSMDEEVGDITCQMNGYVMWNIKRFRKIWVNSGWWILSPKFTYSGQECFISLKIVTNKEIWLRFCSYSFFYHKFYFEFQLRTDSIVSDLSRSQLQQEFQTVVFRGFTDFLSKDNRTPLHDYLTVIFRVFELNGSTLIPDEFQKVAFPASEKVSEIESSYQEEINSKTIKNHASGSEDAPVTEDESKCGETETKSIAASDKPSGNGGKLREISRGVKWDIHLPPSKKTWDVLSPEFTCGGLKYYFRMHSSELYSDDIYLGFIVNISNDINFPLPIRWRMAVKRRDSAGLRWIMNGQMIAKPQCHQHTHEVCIKRAELDCSLPLDFRLTFVHYLIFGEVDEQQEASTQTDKTVVSRETLTEDQIGGTVNLEDFEEQLTLRSTDPEEGDYVHLIQKKPLDPSIEKFFSELSRDNKKDFIFAA